MTRTAPTLNSYEYDAFGNITEKVEAVANTFFYSGYEYDDETGLYYLRTRYYDPKIARFISEDTFSGWYTDPLSLNKYTYTHNNPVSYHDPNGEFINLIAGAVGVLAGAVFSAGANLIGQAISGGKINWKSVGASAAEGAIVGGVAGLTFGNPIAVGLASAAGNAVKQGIDKGFDKINVNEVIFAGATGFLGAGAGKIVGKVGSSTVGQALFNTGKEAAKQAATTIALKTAAGALAGFAVDAVGQGINIALGEQERYNPDQGLSSMLMGGIGAGVGAHAEQNAKYNTAPKALGTDRQGNQREYDWMSSGEANKHAKKYTHNNSSDTVALGKSYQIADNVSYDKYARQNNMTYFKTSDRQWNKLQSKYGTEQMWGINKSFVDQQHGMGKNFVTNLPRSEKRYGGFFLREIDYLKNQFNITLWGD